MEEGGVRPGERRSGRLDDQVIDFQGLGRDAHDPGAERAQIGFEHREPFGDILRLIAEAEALAGQGRHRRHIGAAGAGDGFHLVADRFQRRRLFRQRFKIARNQFFKMIIPIDVRCAAGNHQNPPVDAVELFHAMLC